MPNALARLWTSLRGAAPASTKGLTPGGYWLPISGGWLPPQVGSIWNWWQCGFDVMGGGRSAIVEACVSAYAQTVAMCPGDVWRLQSDGGREREKNSALTRILKQPNAYQSISDFLLNATRSLYIDGNAYALALRNNRFEIDELHLMHPRSCGARIANDGEIFYTLGGNQVVDRMRGTDDPLTGVPARDVLHLRLQTTRATLLGESPLVSAAYDVAASGAITQQQLAFYTNQARPSAVLATEAVLTVEDKNRLRELWNEQSKGFSAGGTPILSHGLKPMTLAMNATDAQLVEFLKLSEQHIALAYRIPLQLLGIGDTPFASTEALMQFWLASGLGFALNHIEEAFGTLFELRGYPDEYLEFDTDALLRSALKDMTEAYARGVSGGIFSPNEARARFQLSKATAGDEPRLQAQVVPLSAAAKIPAAPAAPAAPVARAQQSNQGQGNGQRALSTRRRYRASRTAASL